MNSLDAILQSQADRAKLYKKFSQENPRNTPIPTRTLKPMRLRPGEISRADFGNFFGALAPNAGIVNEFRTQMYQSEMRGLNNRIANINKQPHPGWALWGYGTLPAVQPDGVLQRAYQRQDDKLILTMPPAHTGIQLFFQTPCTDTPLYGAGMCGGALSQLPRTARGYRKTEEAVIKNSRDQARQLTAMRSGQAAAPPLPPVLTALDEAKLSIATSIETIAQQLFRGIYTPGILRDLTVVSATIARNAPLMDTNALSELFRYVTDLTAMLRSNAKNIGKEIAEDGLMMTGSLALGVARDSNVAEAIFTRVEAIAEFLKRQIAVAERPVGERVAVARGALSLLGTNVDRKTYPATLRKKFEQDEADEAERRRVEAERAMAARDALETDEAAIGVVEGAEDEEEAKSGVDGPVMPDETVDQFISELEEFGVDVNSIDGNIKIPRDSAPIATLNAYLRRNGQRIITRTGKDIPLRDALDQASKRGVFIIDSETGERVPINTLLR